MFDSLPQPTALLLLSSLLQLTEAHALHNLPRQTPEPTITLPHHVLNVVSWPIQPTPPPGADLFAYRRRQLDDSFNTICGYVNGQLDLPATCGSGSHCVVDTEHNVVGCCPNGAPSCTAGVFTGCVDGNSGAQTEVNPYVFSCTGAAVCYMNQYEGGFSQYGCGTASDMAATVQNSASGVTAVLSLPTVVVSYTESISTLSESTTLSTASSRASSTTARSSTTPASASSDSTASATPTESVDPAAAPPATDTAYRTGAIVGGTIGGLAVAIALVALVFFFLRRRNANVRQGPGPGGFRGKVISPPLAGGGTGFVALANNDHDAFETGPAGSVFDQQQHQQYSHPYNPQQSQPPMSTNTAPATAATTAAAAAAAAAAGAAASLPPGSANRSMLPPLATTTTGPPMPFQSEVSPVEHHDLDTPLAYSHSALSGAAAAAASAAAVSSAGATSAASSTYPPSSSGGASGGEGLQNNNNNVLGGQQQGGYNYGPAAYAGGSGLMMGMSPLLLSRGAERHLESDQVPLTGGNGGGGLGYGGGGREIDDFSQGFHAALGRIGEEDEEDEEGRRLSRLQQQQNQYQGYQQQGYQDVVGSGGGAGQDNEGGTMDSQGSGQGRPLWQQNRRQSRNLMWM